MDKARANLESCCVYRIATGCKEFLGKTVTVPSGSNDKLPAAHFVWVNEAEDFIPDGYEVYQTCGNQKCCELTHLALRPVE